MDPNANLKAQHDLTQTPITSTADKRVLAELRRSLRDWLAHGGFPPDWSAYPDATRAYRRWDRRAAKFTDLHR